MTSLKGDLRSIMGTPFGGVGHAVLIFSRVTRAAFDSDSVVLQLHDRIEMPEEADGKFRVDGLDPGPIRIELEGGTVHNHGWNIDLPDEGVWSLTDLVDAQVDWSPAVIGRAEAAAREAREHADRAEAGADRVGTAEQVGVWASEASSSASDAASARSAAQTARDASQSARDEAEGHANRAATSESNAAASETNAKQSETNAGDYAAVATTAATESVAAMERATEIAGGDFATRAYVDQKVSSVTLTGTGSPEGKVTAPVGVVYIDSASTNGAVQWIKASGTGRTGWRVAWGDTGWRDISSLLSNEWGGSVHVRRINASVELRVEGLTRPGTSSTIMRFPAGFQPERLAQGFRFNLQQADGTASQARFRIFDGAFFAFSAPTVPGPYYGGATWTGSETWPATLPGTPA